MVMLIIILKTTQKESEVHVCNLRRYNSSTGIGNEDPRGQKTVTLPQETWVGDVLPTKKCYTMILVLVTNDLMSNLYKQRSVHYRSCRSIREHTVHHMKDRITRYWIRTGQMDTHDVFENQSYTYMKINIIMEKPALDHVTLLLLINKT